MIRFLICHALQDVRQAMVFAASKQMVNRQKYSEPCVQCIYVEKCGGCRGVAYGSFGDYFAPDPHCWLDSNGERL